ncbi:hypothetical protein KO507_09625 [Gilvimarinus agarilyticus]|uniref:LPS-assembly lipoprotein LptE n=1 Tax=unclassified Gilvimarinus TaxID=2642066 RepID=UPI001C09608F|nr:MULTISPECIES: LPS assembly lipoprotein LptE [unclassified Gilvimarinus]MBU2886019.1 hypothetical protein [Gilvimarinus agarilyticus]MDO6570765.1 LPS assembly lipoprotein LptE [Gilvimarinus sp. 2_MG-2023]MDO6747642.1 LPS assembly lipoprotein LptE [Gilvimarinus sp. 1_MG-2023]
MNTWLMAALLLLAGCGWQVRGDLLPPFTLESVRLISSEQHTPVQQALSDAFTQSGIEMVTQAGQKAEYRLALEPEELRKRTVGVGTDSLAAAYELQLSQDFQWFDAAGREATGPLTTVVTRSLDASDATGIEREEALLLEEMRRDLAQQILRQSYFQLQPDQAKPE